MKKVILILAASACLIIANTAQAQEIVHQNRTVNSDEYYKNLLDLIEAQRGRYGEATIAGAENWLNVVVKSNQNFRAIHSDDPNAHYEGPFLLLRIPWPTP
jgi:hypothetical protein